MRISWVLWKQSEWQVRVWVDALFCKFSRWKSDILISSDLPYLIDKTVISRTHGTLFTSTLDMNFLDRCHKAVTPSGVNWVKTSFRYRTNLGLYLMYKLSMFCFICSLTIIWCVIKTMQPTPLVVGEPGPYSVWYRKRRRGKLKWNTVAYHSNYNLN